jgi:hypothetical protein
MHIIYKIVPPLFVTAALLMGNDAGCSNETVADKRERQQTELLTEQASTQVGMPAIIRFTEKRNLKMIYEKRDDAKLTTITYIVDLNGKLHKMCDSMGYGFPYATQYSNPHRPISPGHSQTSMLDQPEPNGLFMPNSADGTWILCLDPNTKDLQPVYVEPRVVVSPFTLKVD